MTLYTNGSASRSKVAESHKKWEKEIEAKKEEQLSRTQELTCFKEQALSELGYSSINENNAKEVFEKIAEIMSRKFQIISVMYTLKKIFKIDFEKLSSKINICSEKSNKSKIRIFIDMIISS